MTPDENHPDEDDALAVLKDYIRVREAQGWDSARRAREWAHELLEKAKPDDESGCCLLCGR